MRIVHLAAGAGDTYCGACARDMVLARGMIRLGHDFQIIPLYTPLRIEREQPAVVTEVFLGGINVWLQQHSRLFRWIPARFDRLLSSPALLHWAAGFAVRTDPASLGAMTVSVLAGCDGRQRKEVARLLDYLGTQEPPELVSLTNSLLSGLAAPFKERYGVPVVCALQGEESFVASLSPRYQQEARGLMRANARHIELFLAPGDRYAAEMADYLDVPRERVTTARPGLDLAPFRRSSPRPIEPFTIGYLSVIIPRKGLDLLVAAWIKLARQSANPPRLRVAGRCLNPRYLHDVQQTIARAGLTEHCEFRGELDFAGKVAFLHECSAFAVPSRFPESRGLAIMEAMAAGVPVAMPNSGIYPELVDLLGGGLLHAPGDAESLAAALAEAMLDPAQADRAAEHVRRGLEQNFSPEVTTQRVHELFEAVRART